MLSIHTDILILELICFRVWPTLQTMYWSLYGQVNYQDLDNGHDVLRPETIFGLILFAVWCLVSIIVLLNMLIALIDEAFDKVKKVNR